MWVDGNNINIEGAIPVAGDDIVSATPRCSESEKAKTDSEVKLNRIER